MKTRKTLSSLALTCLVSGLFIISCKKDDSSSVSTAEKQEFTTAASGSDAEAQVAFNDVFDNVIGVNSDVAMGGTGVFAGANTSSDGSGMYGPQGTDTVAHCFTVTLTHLNADTTQYFPVRVVIDFGDGCTGHDGKTRSGKIITEYSKRLIMPGAVAATTFDNYHVNDVKVEGTHTITNQSSGNELKFNVLVDGTLTRPNGNYSDWNSDKTITMVAGLGTPGDLSDDVFNITGNASGIVKIGDITREWSAEITSPLVKKFTCQWLVQGTLSFKKGTQVYGSIDYGTGDCDNQATLIVNGQSAIITLH